ncbi:glycosyltransferase [Streptococcus sp. S784/96/1]|uniref:glycosyltransferase n=1 Tax=Streptococcus sp. S784/96/1 TaxID=2653499 RepID=UPI001389EE38|nr:glycosyltransferase [Streptococcus sp. S784/96/1]
MKKEIVIVTFSLSNNGSERVLSELSSEWARNGHEVTIVQLMEKAFGSDSYQVDKKVNILTLKNSANSKIGKYFSYLLQLKKILNKHSTAAVLSFSFTTQFLLALLRPFISNRIIFSERNDPKRCPYTPFTRFLRTMSFYVADVSVFQTEDAKAMFPKKIQQKGLVIVNPINPNLPLPFEGNRTKKIVTASRLRPQKNLPMLIKAFAKLHRDYPGYYLEIYGIGDEQENLENLISELGLSEVVILKGFATNVHQCIRDASLYVCSSDYEGISNSMLEALGLGIPTITTDCPIGGARQVITHKENGWLVPVGDVEALYVAMKSILDNPILASKLSKQATRVREAYPIHKIANQWIELMK